MLCGVVRIHISGLNQKLKIMETAIEPRVLKALDEAVKSTCIKLNIEISQLSWFTDIINEKYHVWRAENKTNQQPWQNGVGDMFIWTYHKSNGTVTFKRVNKD